MGNLPLTTGLFRVDEDVPEPAADGSSFITSRVTKSITYHYAPSCPAQVSQTSPSSSSSSSSSSPLLLSDPKNTPAPSPRPLLLFFAWLGAQPGPVSKYRDLYLAQGMDVLVVRSSVMHFLWPRWGLEYGAEVLALLEGPRFSARPVLVHASSIGGYTFTQVLTHVARGPERHGGLARRVVGHIYDSLVVGSLEQMAIGLGRTLVPRLESLVRNAALFYFWLFKSRTADVYNDGIRVFQDNPITAPALFFFSDDDVMCNPVAMETCMDLWRGRGVAVASRRWKESTHAAHMRCHPEEYLCTLHKFLSSVGLSSDTAVRV